MHTSHSQTKRERFAQMIAQTFNDQEQLSLYLDCCKKYPVAIVYRAFIEAKSVPPEQVRKSRPAIFFYLVKKYINERDKNTGH